MTRNEANEIIRDLQWIRESIVCNSLRQAMVRIDEIVADYTERYCEPQVQQ